MITSSRLRNGHKDGVENVGLCLHDHTVGDVMHPVISPVAHSVTAWQKSFVGKTLHAMNNSSKIFRFASYTRHRSDLLFHSTGKIFKLWPLTVLERLSCLSRRLTPVCRQHPRISNHSPYYSTLLPLPLLPPRITYILHPLISSHPTFHFTHHAVESTSSWLYGS